jgi:hypothetical protein
MKKLSMIPFLVFSLFFAAANAGAEKPSSVEGVDVSKFSGAQEIFKLHEDIFMSVLKCIGEKKPKSQPEGDRAAKECGCQYKSENLRFLGIIEAFLNSHPELKGKKLSFETSPGAWNTLGTDDGEDIKSKLATCP